MSNYSEDQALLVKLINADCFKDYYTILGLDKNRRTSPEEIRKAYKNLCLRVHPDKNKAPGADEAFKKVNEAYHNLISNSKSNSNSNSNPNPKPRRYNPPSCARRDNSSNSNPNPKPRSDSDSDLDLDLDLAVFFMVVGGVVVVVCVTVFGIPIYRGSTQMQMVPFVSTGPGKFILLTATAIAGICMWWSS